MEEELIGRAGNPNDEINIISSQYKTFLCGNCKKKLHCIAGYKEGEAPVLVKDRCNNKSCECRCRRYYVAKNGRLRKYGVIDDTSAVEDFLPIERGEVDDIIDKVNEQFRQKKEDVQVL